MCILHSAATSLMISGSGSSKENALRLRCLVRLLRSWEGSQDRTVGL